jgi:hypothetical protein
MTRDTVRLDDEELVAAIDERAEELGSRSEAYREAVRRAYLEGTTTDSDDDGATLPKAAREGYEALREHANAGERMAIDTAESIIAQRVQLRKETVRSSVIQKLHGAGWLAVEQGIHQVSVVLHPRMASDGGHNPDDRDADVLDDSDTDDVDVDAEFDRLESAEINRGDGVETDGGRDVLPASRVVAALAHNPNVRRGEIRDGDRLRLYLTNSGISHHVLRHLRALGWEVIGITPRFGSVTCKPVTDRAATPKTDTLAVQKHRGRRVITDGGRENWPTCPVCEESDNVACGPEAGYWYCAQCGERGSGTLGDVTWWRNDPDSQWYVDDGDEITTDGGRVVPSDYDSDDGWGDNGLEQCPHCGDQLGGESGRHEDVYDQRGRHFEYFLDTDSSKGPFFCPDCWDELDRNQKAEQNDTLEAYTDGGNELTEKERGLIEAGHGAICDACGEFVFDWKECDCNGEGHRQEGLDGFVTDGGLPESITELAAGNEADELQCRDCGDSVAREYLDDRLCPGCRLRTTHDGGSATIASATEPRTDGAGERIGVSPLTGIIYAVAEYEEDGDGRITAFDKRPLSRAEIGARLNEVHGPARRYYREHLGGNRDD